MRAQFDFVFGDAGVGVFYGIRQRFSDGGEDVVAGLTIHFTRGREKGGNGVPHRARGIAARDAVEAELGVSHHLVVACDRSDRAAARVSKIRNA